MKINPPAPPTTPLAAAPKASAAAAAGADAAERAKEAALKSAARVRAMPNPAVNGEFDAERVAAIREDIRAGRYQINPEGIADGLLASVRDLIDSKPTP
ncbi:flagellar biosynthesis anti-sigma factor FlgM [Variovorax sp. N23]|uniref:flagellar biosynthesis anti-sigma factor FlgM n=1 Tax=Variovorax sp. N23 TaxID=2980555 RepID=UPI0021C7734E|nr:flagellar biosynthesis anti-sigma factor FlgM [Variovorax sp. N23]MCU4118010.1 flagellar biosynthesis anti-sigma factor FlgM [Variovorax sp. N23]